MQALGKLAEQQKLSVARHLQISVGFMEIARTLLRSSAEESQLRTGLSRLYYAFFHAGQALLITLGWSGQQLEHGQLPLEMDRFLGKSARLGRMIRSLYELRKCSDYDNPRFFDRFDRDLEKARRAAVYELLRCQTNFNWMYYEARKALSQ